MSLTFDYFDSIAPSTLLAELHAQCFAKAWSEEDFKALLIQDNVIALVASDNSEPVGFILFQHVLETAEILTLGVPPKNRKKSIGFNMLCEGISKLNDMDIERIFLEVASNNEAAKALYRRAGFQQSGIRKNYYKEQGRKIDALLLEYNLTQN